MKPCDICPYNTAILYPVKLNGEYLQVCEDCKRKIEDENGRTDYDFENTMSFIRKSINRVSRLKI
jgi:ribosome-binding protein aMBF1 (putative translation factor)